MRIPPEISGVSVVLLGRFNPATLNRDWVVNFGAITEAQARAAEVQAIQAEICLIKFESFILHVDVERFTVSTQQAPFTVLLDFAWAIFGEHLVHTPISRIGINRTVHFSAGSREKWDELGRLLAPREPWGDWASCIDEGELPKRGGLRSITMEAKSPKDRVGGQIRARLEPSTVVATGIFMEINDEYACKNTDRPGGAFDMIKTLHERFESSLKNSEWIVDQIMSTIEKLR